ncbi:glycosyltransferase family 2 protein [Macellibacteroides fermentans]|uniref:glycosyltransferase family 2 protein n=1 Tax=Macellibacteroides fermentans TaxID=879969 RepID=UPI00406D2260
MISIILVNYNTRQMTDDCIKSILQQTKNLEYEIILVDNASNDGSKEFFSSDSRLSKYIWLDENVGFGRANNEGIKVAKGEFIFLLNTDSILRNDVLQCFVDAAKDLNTDCFVLGSWLKGANNENVASCGEFSSIKDELKRAINVYISRIRSNDYRVYYDYSKYLTPVDVVIGADMFISKKVVEKSGIFDPAFFMYYEEMDWQLRMSKLGIPRYIVNTPDIVHLCGGSQGVVSNNKKMSRLLRITKSMFIYLRKYNNGMKVFCFKIAYFILRLFPIMFVTDYSLSDKISYYKLLIREK